MLHCPWYAYTVFTELHCSNELFQSQRVIKQVRVRCASCTDAGDGGSARIKLSFGFIALSSLLYYLPKYRERERERERARERESEREREMFDLLNTLCCCSRLQFHVVFGSIKDNFDSCMLHNVSLLLIASNNVNIICCFYLFIHIVFSPLTLIFKKF